MPPPSTPPPSVPPVTLNSVNDLVSTLLALDPELVEEKVVEERASLAVETLGTMFDATSGGTSGTEVATALVAGIESVGSALLLAMEVKAFCLLLLATYYL